MTVRSAERGFTLIEVLVALAIVAVALGAGIQAAGALANNTQRMLDVTSAQWCADNELANLKLSRQFPSIGDTEFKCSQLGREYKGLLSVRPTPNPNFRRADAQMSDTQEQTLLRVSTVLGRY
jgi:general secretion pathway protein I